MGARSPTRLTMPTMAWKALRSAGGATSRSAVSSSIRRSIALARLGMSAYAAAMTISEPKANASSGNIIDTLHLDFDDLTDPDVPDRLHHDGGQQQHLTHVLAEEDVHVVRVDEHQRDAEHRGQREQDVASHTAMRRINPHLPENLEALTHDVRQVLEDLGQVAARFALDQHGGSEKTHIDDRHPVCQVVERVLERQAKVLLIERLTELRSHRLVHLVGYHLQACRERVPRLQGAGNQVERLRERFLERTQPLSALVVQHHERQREAEGRAHWQPPSRPNPHRHQQGHDRAADHRDEQQGTDRRLHARLLDPAADCRSVARAPDEVIDRRERTGLALLEQLLGVTPALLDWLQNVLEPRLEPLLRHHARALGHAEVPAHHDGSADDECEADQDDNRHYRTSV